MPPVSRDAPTPADVQSELGREHRGELAVAAGRQLADLLSETRSEAFSIGPGLSPGRAEELVAAIRADRDAN